jgi:hypothetical protein
MRSVAVGDLRNMPEPGLAEVFEKRREKSCACIGDRRRRSAAAADPGLDECGQQPRPDGSLVIAAVASGDAAGVVTRVARIV